MKLTKAKLKKLQNDLKGVSLKPLAEQEKKSEQALYRTLSGKNSNFENIKALVDFRDKVVQEKKEVFERI